jgi:uncharacterized protein YndB with AHSA1/START domain
MSEFEHSVTIDAPVDDVFAFVSDVRNLAKYLPTTTEAAPAPGGRVHLEGEARHHHYEAEGAFRADRQRNRLEWGADGGNYSGWLQVVPRDDGRSQVTVHLSFSGAYPGASHGNAPTPDEIQEGLTRALESVDRQVTGRGGKVEPRAATAPPPA